MNSTHASMHSLVPSSFSSLHMQAPERLAKTLNQYGVFTLVLQNTRATSDMFAKFKDGTLWLIRVYSTGETPQNLTLPNVLNAMNLQHKAYEHQAIPVMCCIEEDEARFYQLSRRNPFTTISLI